MHPHPTSPGGDLGRTAAARRRLRRSASRRLFCSTNGCPTLLVPDDSGRTASCPICGLQRRLEGGRPDPRDPARARQVRSSRRSGALLSP